MRLMTPASLLALFLAPLGCATTTAATRDRQIGYEVAEVLVAHHAYEQAMPLLQQAVADDPQDARVHVMLGIVLRDQALYAQAEEELLLGHRLDPKLVDACAALGVLYDKWGRHTQAESWHRRAMALVPRSADFTNNLGFSYYLRGDWARSIAAYEEALRYDPTNRRLANNLGFARARQGDLNGALVTFEHAGGRAAALANLGLCYQMRGDATSAKTYYQEALKLDKRQEAARKNLAVLVAAQSPTPAPGD